MQSFAKLSKTTTEYKQVMAAVCNNELAETKYYLIDTLYFVYMLSIWYKENLDRS